MIRRESTKLKLSGGGTRLLSSYHTPKPRSANLFQGKNVLGSFLRPGATSACPRKLVNGIRYLVFKVSNNVMSAFTWASGKGSLPLLSNSILKDTEFISVTFPHLDLPACQERR